MSRLGILTISLLALAGCVRSAGTQFGIERAVDGIFRKYIEPHSPGCAVGVARNNATLLSKGYGLADVAAAIPNTPGTVFKVASVSKMFTAASALLLAADGKISLDDDIRTYLPELPDYGAHVSIRNLLSHTGGMPEYEQLYDDDEPGYDRAARADQLEAIASLPTLVSQPGERYAYTNTDYVVLAAIVERVSGRSLQDFAEAHIFSPLKMGDTAFRASPAIVPNGAIPYAEADGRFTPMYFGAHIGPTGLQTTVADLLKWGDDFSHPVVGGAALIEAMQTRTDLNNGAVVPYGYGLMLDRIGDHPTLYHSGATAGVRTMFAYVPDQDLTVTFLCNRDDVKTKNVLSSLIALFDR